MMQYSVLNSISTGGCQNALKLIKRQNEKKIPSSKTPKTTRTTEAKSNNNQQSKVQHIANNSQQPSSMFNKSPYSVKYHHPRLLTSSIRFTAITND